MSHTSNLKITTFYVILIGISTVQTPMTQSTSLCLIVVDAANVAMRYGQNQKFSCKGIKIVMEFFKLRGHRVIAFLPVFMEYFDFIIVRPLSCLYCPI